MPVVEGTPGLARDLDLNLLRVFLVVAEGGSVTGAASRLYLTQPAVSAALRRLSIAVGAPLFAKHGRGLVLTARGEKLLAEVRAPLLAITRAAEAAPELDLRTNETAFRLGLGDALEALLVPPLLRVLAREAPKMRMIVLPVQFRTIAEAFAARRVDLAVTVADELPRDIRRQTLFAGGFVCLFDPRHARLSKTMTEREYFAHEHVIVSYNGDLRGIVEDLFQKARSIRCSLPSFAVLGAVIEDTPLLATVPALVAAQIRARHPALRVCPLPFRLEGSANELLWPAALDDDPAMRFVRGRVAELVRGFADPTSPTARAGRDKTRTPREKAGRSGAAETAETALPAKRQR